MDKNEKPPSMSAENRWNHIPRRRKIFDLADDQKVAFKRAVSKIVEQRSRVEGLAGTKGVKGYAQGLMLAFNQNVANKPVFWCFNNWAEPCLFVNDNDDKRPLYALHSYHGVLETWRQKTRFHEHFADLYLQEVRSACEDEPILIGNCQGAPIMESIAILYSKEFNKSPLLVTIDYFPRRQYRGPMLLLYGRKSNFNPFYNSDDDPLPAWRAAFDNFGWGILDAKHGGYFRKSGLSHLRMFVQKAIDVHQSGRGFGQCELVVSSNV